MVGALASELEGVRFERFGPGADGGVDLRHQRSDGSQHLLQCKHYRRSTWASLRASAAKEAQHVKALAPSRYGFATSLSLTPGRKAEIIKALMRPQTEPSDVWGLEDLEDLLDRFPTVERAHLKLWLSRPEQLEAILRSATRNRSASLVNDIEQDLPRFVETEVFRDARDAIADSGVLVLAGQPGVGKTVIARMLAAEAAANGCEIVDVSGDINEAWDAFDPQRNQMFVYDDFLGQTVIRELRKNEPSRLVSFMKRVERSNRSRIVLTTREHLLREALDVHEVLRRTGLVADRVVIDADSLTERDRGLILFTHLWHVASLSQTEWQEFAEGRRYLQILGHRNFAPRIIEFAVDTGRRADMNAPEESLFACLLRALKNPEDLWRTPVDHQLTEAARTLLYSLASFAGAVPVEQLKRTWRKVAGGVGVSDGQAFKSSLHLVEGTFVRVDPGVTRDNHDVELVDIANPGLRDFLERRVRDDPALTNQLYGAAGSLEQVLYLRRICGASVQARSETFAAFVEALARCLWIETEGAWWRVMSRDQSVTWRPKPFYRWERLEAVAAYAQDGPQVLAVTRQVFDRIHRDWEEGDSPPLDGAVTFARLARAHGWASSEQLRRLSAEAMSSVHWVEDWEYAAAFKLAVGESWDSEVQAIATSSAALWLESFASGEFFLGEELDPDYLDRFEESVLALEVSLAPDLLARARLYEEQRLDDEIDNPIMPRDVPLRTRQRRVSEEAGREELDALFRSAANGTDAD